MPFSQYNDAYNRGVLEGELRAIESAEADAEQNAQRRHVSPAWIMAALVAVLGAMLLATQLNRAPHLEQVQTVNLNPDGAPSPPPTTAAPDETTTAFSPPAPIAPAPVGGGAQPVGGSQQQPAPAQEPGAAPAEQQQAPAGSPQQDPPPADLPLPDVAVTIGVGGVNT